MGEVLTTVKAMWLYMIEPPWRHSGSERQRSEHWFAWFTGWVWSLAGVALGALIAPLLVRIAGLSNTQYQGTLVIAIAVVAGFCIQALGWLILAFAAAALEASGAYLGGWKPSYQWSFLVMMGILPLTCVGFCAYLYLTWVGAGQRSVTIAFVGALLIKTFLIPFIKGIVTGAIFKWFMSWLRGDKVKTKDA